ncbi:hypothetical protein PoB_000049700 [Plakobranchus ocellatus]|uniref:N-acetyltransferase domain-containing protein n=1 Tax=Plakobranchus ocellatus TaxID=259542 RepID=A0AAV3XV55_9GAST|nr:hypothetical protein PoB_000049700 [Plakobranchus ocellatus]
MALSSSVEEKIIIRKAEDGDCEEIVRLIEELAEFEKMKDQVKITADILRKDCFGERPLCSCIVASKETDRSSLVGYCLYYPVYSTWEGASLYLEDVYVTPSHRLRGIGRLLWQNVAQAGLDMGCSRLNLAVLGWNKNAKDWYERLGCVDLTDKEDWHLMRLDRKGMESSVHKDKELI